MAKRETLSGIVRSEKNSADLYTKIFNEQKQNHFVLLYCMTSILVIPSNGQVIFFVLAKLFHVLIIYSEHEYDFERTRKIWTI